MIAGMLSILLCQGCGSSNTGEQVTPANSTASETSSPSNVKFSCTIDGQAVSGGPKDPLQFYNIGSINEVGEGKELLFYLNDAKSGEQIQDFTHALRFSIPCKTGTSSFGHEENGWGIEVDIKSDKDHQATYFSDSFTVTISDLSSAHASGTFSGKFKLREGALNPDYKKEIEVTDGKFDVPVSNGNVRPT